MFIREDKVLTDDGTALYTLTVTPEEHGRYPVVFTRTPYDDAGAEPAAFRSEYEPYIRADWVRPGTHLSCIGADMSGKQELDSALFRKALAFGDDTAQCFAVGECEKPHKEGVLPALRAEIGDVLLGKAPGRSAAEEITVFDSTGIALQDLASAAVILKAAEAAGVGVVTEV